MMENSSKSCRNATFVACFALICLVIWGLGDAMLPAGKMTPLGDLIMTAGDNSPVRVANNAELAAYRFGGVVERDGYSSRGDGGRAIYAHTSAACSLNNGSGDDGSQIKGARGGCWIIDSKERITPQIFGGGPFAADTVNCAAFQKALFASPVVYVEVPGTYKTSCSIVPGPAQGSALIGVGSRAISIVETNARLPAIRLADNSVNCSVRGFALYHLGKPAAGGDGFDSGSNTASCFHDDIFSHGNFNGFDLRSTSRGIVHNLNAQLNTNNGFDISNTASLGASGIAVQWTYEHAISTSNTGAGFNFHTNAGIGANGMTLDPLENLYTFANGAQGVRFLGSYGNPINDIRMIGGFFGSDGLQEMYFDSYGQTLNVVGTMCEINKSGDEVFVTANNDRPQFQSIEVSNPTATQFGSAGGGLTSNASGTTVSSSHIWSDGSAGVGITLNGADSQIFGGRVHGFGTGVSITGARSSLFGPMLEGNNKHARKIRSDTTEVSAGLASQSPP